MNRSFFVRRWPALFLTLTLTLSPSSPTVAGPELNRETLRSEASREAAGLEEIDSTLKSEAAGGSAGLTTGTEQITVDSDHDLVRLLGERGGLDLISPPGASSAGLEEFAEGPLEWNELGEHVADWVALALDMERRSEEEPKTLSVAVRLIGPDDSEARLTFHQIDPFRRQWPGHIQEVLSEIGVSNEQGPWTMTVKRLTPPGEYRVFPVTFKLYSPPSLPTPAGMEESVEEMVKRMGSSQEPITQEQIEEIRRRVLKESGDKAEDLNSYLGGESLEFLSDLIGWMNASPDGPATQGSITRSPDFELTTHPFNTKKLGFKDPVARASLVSWAMANFPVFDGGNHRTGWALMNVLLLRAGIIQQPMAWEAGKEKEYYKTLKRLDLPLFVALIKSYLPTSPPAAGMEEAIPVGKFMRRFGREARVTESLGRGFVPIAATADVERFTLFTDGSLAVVAKRKKDEPSAQDLVNKIVVEGDLRSRERVPDRFPAPGLIAVDPMEDSILGPFVWPEETRVPVRIVSVSVSEMQRMSPLGWIALSINQNLTVKQLLDKEILLLTVTDEQGRVYHALFA